MRVFRLFVFFAGFKVAAIGEIPEHLKSDHCTVIAVESFSGGQIYTKVTASGNGLEMIDVVNVI